MYGLTSRLSTARKRLLVRAGAAAAAALAAGTAFGVTTAGGAPHVAVPLAVDHIEPQARQVADQPGQQAAPQLDPTSAPAPAAGAIFVSPDGDDGAAGTLDRPLRTVKAAVAKVRDGGTVVLRGGDYREALGAITKRITLQNFRSEVAWLKGTDVIRSWVPDGTAWRATEFTSPFCQSCLDPTAIDPAHALAGSPDQAFLDGVPLTQVARGALRPGTFAVDPASHRLFLGSNPAGHTVEAAARSVALTLTRGAAGSKLLGLRFTGFSPLGTADQPATVVDNAPGSLLQGNLITRSAGRALGVFAEHVGLLGNGIVDNGGAGGLANRADGILVRGNHFDGNNTEHFTLAAGPAGLKVTHTAGVTVDANTFDGNDGNGFWCDLGCTAGTITGNQASDNSLSGLLWSVSSHATMSGNTMVGNALGMAVSGSDHVRIVRNTFSGNATQLGVYDDARSAATDLYAAALRLTWNTTDAVVTGNTFSGGRNLLLDTNHQQVGATQMFGQLTGNTVGGAQRIWWCPSNCVAYQTLSAFRQATGLNFGGTGTSVPSVPTQYLTDPGFEAMPLVWRTFGPATALSLIGTPGTARSGQHALQVLTTGLGLLPAGATGTPATLRTIAGHRYRASCWVRSSAPVNVRLQLQEYSVSWQPAGDPAPADAVAKPAGWSQVAVTYTAVKTGDQLPLSVFSTDLAPLAKLLVDDCALTDA